MSKEHLEGTNKGYRAHEAVSKSIKAFSLSIMAGAVKTRPEPAVLTDNSLHTLAKEIDADLRFPMLLCIPTTQVIRMKDDAENNGWPPSLLTHQMLMEWKAYRRTAKDKDKVNDIEKALRDMNKHDVADVFIDRHRQNIDITPDAFQS